MDESHANPPSRAWLVWAPGAARVKAYRTGCLSRRHLVHTGNQAIESALSRALRLWSGQPSQFSELAANCMRADYSWALPGADYLDIYQDIRHR